MFGENSDYNDFNSDFESKTKTYIGSNLGCLIVVLLVNFFAGGWSINYLLAYFADKTIPFIWAGTLGFLTGEISIPIAIVIAILEKFAII